MRQQHQFGYQAILAVLVVVLTAGSLYAHHSYAQFDTEQKVSVEGTIERVRFANPHVVLTIKTTDSQTYTLEWMGTSQLKNAGINVATLLSGQQILVTGSPRRDNAHYLSLLQELRRPADGWSWSRQPPRR